MLSVAVCLIAVSTPSFGDTFVVTFENLQSTGGFSLTPAWVGFHDGTFDLFNTGATASPQLEALAELGDVSGIQGIFGGDDSVIAAPGGLAGLGVVSPGESGSVTINTAAGNDFFSYASMVIPSNDTFIGNGNPTQFSAPSLGNTLTIDVVSFYDAGTEVNDRDDGAAFSTTGGGGAGGVAEGGTVQLADLTAFNNTFRGTSIPGGTTITSDLAFPIARFTITSVPEPGTAAFFGVFAFGLLARRRRRND